jgi:hypothetical protein
LRDVGVALRRLIKEEAHDELLALWGLGLHGVSNDLRRFGLLKIGREILIGNEVLDII